MGAMGKLGTEWKEFGAGTAAQNLRVELVCVWKGSAVSTMLAAVVSLRV